MRKWFICLLLFLCAASMFAWTAAAESPPDPVVYVTIADKGEVVVAERALGVKDVDDDGVLTIHDALYAAHEATYSGGAAAGYGAGTTDWGFSLLRLWGDDSGNFGYYLNDASAWSLTDTVKDGDRLVAFVYTDTSFYSDAYAFFDTTRITVEEKSQQSVTLMLSYIGYDADYNAVQYPLADASITVNGEKTTYTTDESGKVTLLLPAEAGVHVISATHKDMILVPPVCVAEVTASPVNVSLIIGLCIGAAVLASGAAVFTVVYKKTSRSEKE